MKRLKTFAGVFTAIALTGGIAFGGWNIQQKDNGGTVWRDDRGGGSAPVGDTGFIVYFTNLNDAGTRMVVARKGGVVTKAYVTQDSRLPDGTPSVITFSFNSDGTGQSFQPITGLSITPTGLPGQIVSDEPDSNAIVKLSEGSTIAIINSGAGSITTNATVTIVIE